MAKDKPQEDSQSNHLVSEVTSIPFLLKGKSFFDYLKTTNNGNVIFKDVNFQLLSMSYGTPEQQMMLLNGTFDLVGNVMLEPFTDTKFQKMLEKKMVDGEPKSAEDVGKITTEAFMEYMKAKIKDPKFRAEINKDFRKFYNDLIDKDFLPEADKKELKAKIKDMTEAEMLQFMEKSSPLLQRIFVGITKDQMENDGLEFGAANKSQDKQLLADVNEAKMPDASIKTNKPAKQQPQQSI